MDDPIAASAAARNVLRRLGELTTAGNYVPARLLADGFEYSSGDTPTLIPPGGRIPQWFTQTLDDLVRAGYVERQESPWWFEGTPAGSEVIVPVYRPTADGRRRLGQWDAENAG